VRRWGNHSFEKGTLVLSRLRSNLTSAHVLAGAALFVSLGGTSYAVGVNTIGSKQIKNGSVQSADIGNGKVTSKDIKNQTLSGKDIANGRIAGGDIKDGTLTPAKFKAGSIPAGAKGAKGDRGTAGATTVHTVQGNQALCNVPSGTNCTTGPSNAVCPTGETLVGGGAYSGNDDALIVSAPTGSATRSTTWQAQTRNLTNDGGANVRAVALCAVP